MLDRIDAPTLLVEHRVAHHAGDRQLVVLLQRVVLQVLVAAVAVDQQPPVRVARPNATQQRQTDRGALDVERLVVLDHLDRSQRIDRLGVGRDLLAQHLEVHAPEELARLGGVARAVTDAKRERLEPGGARTTLEQRAVERHQHGAAVDAA